MRWGMVCRAAAVCAVISALSTLAAQAQYYPPPSPPSAVVPAPPPGSEAADIAACLCVRQAIDVLGADMAAKRQSYDQVQSEIGSLDAQMQQERSTIDVNDPRSVSRFRQLLDRRDALFRRSTGQMFSDLSSVTERYNARVNEYNARCADRPRNPALLAQVQASLTCPPP